MAGLKLASENIRLRNKLEKVAAWLDRLEKCSLRQAEVNSDFPGYAEACRADAKNYRKTADDIRSVL